MDKQSVFLFFSENKILAPAPGGGASRAHLTACRYGSNCRSMKDPHHTARFSHPSS